MFVTAVPQVSLERLTCLDTSSLRPREPFERRIIFNSPDDPSIIFQTRRRNVGLLGSYKNVIKAGEGCPPVGGDKEVGGWLANASLICPGWRIDGSNFVVRSREDALLKRGRDPPKFTAVISLIVPRHNLFFTRTALTDAPHSHSSRCSAATDGRRYRAVPWPFAGDATRLLSSELLVAVEWQQAEAGAIRCRLRMK